MSKAEKTAAHRNKLSNQKLFSSMNKVYQVNRQHDHELDMELEDIRRKEHMESVRRYSDMRQLQRTLSDMRLEQNRLRQTFTSEEIDDAAIAPVMSWRKIQTKRMQNRPRPVRQRKSEGTKALLAVAENAELSAKSKFRSAIMAVCLSKAFSRIGEDDGDDQTKYGDKKTVTFDQEPPPDEHSVKKSGDADGPIKDIVPKNTNESSITRQTVSQGEARNGTPNDADATKRDAGRLSVLDLIMRNSRKSQETASDPGQKSNVIPTFGQLHARRRSSGQLGSIWQRRLSTVNAADAASKSSSNPKPKPRFRLDHEGRVRRISVISDDDTDLGFVVGPQSNASESNANSGVTKTRRNAKKPTALSDAYGRGYSSGVPPKASPAMNSFHRRRKRELAKQDRETMNRVRQFLDSSMPT